MKNRFLFLVPLILVGCANITFDARQYDSLIVIRERIEEVKGLCANKEQVPTAINRVQTLLSHELTYATYRRNSSQVSSSLQSLIDIAAGMQSRYKIQSEAPSVTYCTEKTSILSSGVTTIISTIGKL
jgi:hypothetical protein